jgi:hypothetical protein
MRPVQNHEDTAVYLQGLSSEISSVLLSRPDIGKEFKLLFSRALKDPPMAIARARRLLEVLVAQGLDRHDKPGLSNTKKLPCLEKMIETFTATQPYSKELASICHAVRLEGNRILHYHPGGPVSPKTSPSQLVGCLRRVSEVAEITTTGNTTIYTTSLGPRLAAMYQRLRGPLSEALNGKMEGNFPLSEALLLLFRSLADQFEPEWLDWLARLDENGNLSVGLTQEDEHAIRQLRNRSLIGHDGEWLFTPTRSERAFLSKRGQFLLHLAGYKGGDVAEELARDVVGSLGEFPRGSHLFALLKRLQWSGHFTKREKPSVQILRNRNFVSHSTYFLAAATIVMPTELGFYVLRTVRD